MTLNRKLGYLAGILSAVIVFGATQNCSASLSGTKNNSVELGEQGQPIDPGTTVEPTLTRTDFLTGLSNPWDLAFTNDGIAIFTERCKGLSVRHADGKIVRLFGTSGSAVVATDLFCEGQSGMQGVAVDPNFSTNRFIYVYMSSNQSSPKTNRVIRLTVDADFTTVRDRTDIITDIAYKNAGNSWGGPGSHSGGRIRFSPNGYLFVTTGDNHNGPLPQDLTKLGGKILRVDRNGAAIAGNNAPSGADPRVFTYGHRNVQGIAFRPGTHQPFSSEHGPGHHDEVTPLTAGGNGGWDPKPEAGVTCADNYCGYTSNKADGSLTPMTDLNKFPSAMPPIWDNGGLSQGMGPCTFLKGSQWKAWNGQLAVGIMGGTRVEIIKMKLDGTFNGTTTAKLPAERMRSVVQGPDGNLYVVTDSGNIWKVSPQ